MEKNEWREGDGALVETHNGLHLIPLPGGKSQVWKYYGMYSQDGVRILPQHSSKVYCLVPGCANPEMVYCGNTTNLYGHLQRKHPDVIQPQKRVFLPKTKVKPGPRFTQQKRYLKMASQRYARKTRRLLVPKEEDLTVTISEDQMVEDSSVDVINIHYDESNYDEQNNVAHNHYTVSNSLSVDLQEGTDDVILIDSNEGNQTELRFAEVVNQFPEKRQEFVNRAIQTGVENEEEPNQAPPLTSEHLTDALLDLMVSDLSGAQLLQRPGFQCFLNTIYPRYDPPPVQSVQANLKSRFEACKSALQVRLKDVKLVGVTNTIWTSKYDGRKYAQVSASYIDSEWTLHQRILSNFTADFGHEEEVKRVLDEFGIQIDKVVSFTSHAVPKPNKDDPPNFQCFMTALDQAFLSGIEIGSLEQLQKLCLSSNLISISDNPRLKWSSVFHILDNFIRGSNDPSDMRGVHSFLGYMLKVMTILDEVSTRASMLVPFLAQIRNHCLSPAKSDHVQKVATEVRRCLDNQYKDPKTVRFLEKCTFLDPRFKDSEIFCNKPVLQKEILDEMNLHIEIPNIEFVNDNCQFLKDLFGSLPKSKLKSTEQKMASELDYYMDFPAASYEENPVHWWKKHQDYFPTLSRLALKYLCVPIKVPKISDISTTMQPDLDMLFLNNNSDLIKKTVHVT